MKKFLQNLTSLPLYDVHLFDKDGYILASSLHKNCWSKYLDHNETIASYFPKEYSNILSNDKYIGESFSSSVVFLNNDEKKKPYLCLLKGIISSY